MAGRRRLPFLTTCSDMYKPYMILKALDESYKNHIGFIYIRASGEEWQPPTSRHVYLLLEDGGSTMFLPHTEVSTEE